MRKLSILFVKEIISSITNEEYSCISEEYLGNLKELIIKHNTCGKEYKTCYDAFVRKGQRCRCIPKITESDFIESLNSFQGKETYTVIAGSYINSKTKVKVTHNVCNNEFEIDPAKILSRKDTCPHCSNKGSGRWTTEKLKDFISSKYNNEFILVGEYKNSKTNIIVSHSICNHSSEVLPEMILRPSNSSGKFNCQYCNGHNKNITMEYFVEEVSNIFGGEYTILPDNTLYEGTHSKVKIRHNYRIDANGKSKPCNHEYITTRNSLLKVGNKCPKCSGTMYSTGEKEILAFIKDISSKKEVIYNNYRDIDGISEIDIYIPSKHIAFEYNGLYWHSEEFAGKKKHLDKLNKCADNGIRLITIFEDEWLHKREIVKSKISNILGIPSERKIYARKCEVREISYDIKNTFLEENHILGKDSSATKLGLFFKNELVSVMTFCNIRKSLGNNYSEGLFELSRFASKLDTSVIGGFSKIFTYFIRNYEFTSIITYADLRWSEGNIYSVCNFEFSHVSDPSYWYIKNHRRFHRYGFRKNVLSTRLNVFDDELTEYQNMYANGYKRIWDCGQLVYRYSCKD